MQHQFKAGDLALIVGARKVPENIGKVCELMEFLQIGAVSQWRYSGNGLPIQHVGQVAGWIVIGEGLISASGNPGYVLFRESFLMPLKGDQTPTQINTETPKEVAHG